MSASNNKVSRRDFLRLAGLTGGAALLTACGAPSSPEPEVEEKPSEGVEEAAPGREPVTITWWNQFSSATCQEMFPKIVEDFEELYPWITVDFEISGGPPGGGEYIEVLLTRIAGGNPPDTATLWTPPVQFATQGSLLAIDEYIATAEWAKPGAFYENPLKSCQWRGKTYGLPSSAGCTAIMVNTAKFEEKGISTEREDFPNTWDDLKALSAEFVVWEGDELKHAGFVPWAAGWTNVLWSGLNGGKLFDEEEEKYFLDSDENIEWLDYMVKWLDEQYKGDIELLNMYGNWGGVQAEDGFGMGLSAMAEAGSWACTDDEIPFGWEVVEYPVGSSGTTSQTAWWPNWWVVPAGSPHPYEAFLFAEYLSTKGWETWYAAVMDTPAWKDFSPDIITEKLVDVVGSREKALEIHEFFANYLERAVPMWNSPIEDFAANTLGQAVDEILHETKTPQTALDEAQELCQVKLDELLAEI